MTLKDLRVKRAGRRTRRMTPQQWLHRWRRIKAHREKIATLEAK